MSAMATQRRKKSSALVACLCSGTQIPTKQCVSGAALQGRLLGPCWILTKHPSMLRAVRVVALSGAGAEHSGRS